MKTQMLKLCLIRPEPVPSLYSLAHKDQLSDSISAMPKIHMSLGFLTLPLVLSSLHHILSYLVKPKGLTTLNYTNLFYYLA